MLIQGPNGDVALVDGGGRLNTFAVSTPEDKHLNHEGRVFSVYFEETASGADDYFFYLKNTGIADIYITDIRASCSASTTVFYERVSGTPSYAGVTAITAVNRNLGSAALLEAITNSDANITGLTSEGVLFFDEFPAANTRNSIKTSSNLIVPQGKAIAFRRSAASGTVRCMVSVVGAELV